MLNNLPKSFESAYASLASLLEDAIRDHTPDLIIKILSLNDVIMHRQNSSSRMSCNVGTMERIEQTIVGSTLS